MLPRFYLPRNPLTKPHGVLGHCREGEINCWFSIPIFRGVSFWPHPLGGERCQSTFLPSYSNLINYAGDFRELATTYYIRSTKLFLSFLVRCSVSLCSPCYWPGGSYLLSFQSLGEILMGKEVSCCFFQTDFHSCRLVQRANIRSHSDIRSKHDFHIVLSYREY